jgi:hypothetical protein
VIPLEVFKVSWLYQEGFEEGLASFCRFLWNQPLPNGRGSVTSPVESAQRFRAARVSKRSLPFDVSFATETN